MEEAREHIPRERIAVEATSEATDLTGPEEVEEGRGRRRKRNEDKYSTNIRVKKRARGESYSPCHKEAVRVPAREMKSPCPNSCRRKCSVRFSEHERKGFLDAYWALAEYKKQRQYISNNVKRDNKHRKRKRKDSESRRDRQVTLTYYLGETVVCKRMFLNTLDVGETFVRNCVKATDPATHIVAEQRKPEHGGRKLADEKVNLIKNHIKSFPVMESHYLMEQTKRKHLSSNLNLCKMYDLFLKKHADIENLPKICSYTKIFLEKFNLGFHKPKKDQCSQCNAYKNMTPEQKKENEEEHKLHLINKEKARQSKENAKASAIGNKDL